MYLLDRQRAHTFSWYMWYYWDQLHGWRRAYSWYFLSQHELFKFCSCAL